MFPRIVLVFVLMTWSFSWISPERSPRWRKQIRRTLRTVKEIDANVKFIKEQFEGEESGPITLYITLDNATPFEVTGNIIYEDEYRQKYSVDALSLEKIVPLDDLFIISITGQTENGLVCASYIKEENEDPKQKFQIVEDGEGGCVILPSSEQYHQIGKTHWYENGELVTQQDHFHPGTREAILKTEAHGNIFATAMVFQARESTRSRRSTGFGLMVTAWGNECHINKLTEEMDVNPEHMLVPRSKSSANTRMVETTAAPPPDSRTVHKYVRNLVTTTEIISPDDDRVKLTETMKKECEGKTIYYNREHVLQSGEDFRLGITGVQSKEEHILEKMLPQSSMNETRRDGRSTCGSNDIETKFSTTDVGNCGTWRYGGVTYTNNSALPPPAIEITQHHFHTTWTVAAQCCNEEGTNFFPCANIADGDSANAEQAFSTAFALSLGRYYNYAGDYSPFCLGMSRYCEWDSEDTTYAAYGVSGACTNHCNSQCAGYKPFGAYLTPSPNGCYKCFGMYPDFYAVPPYMPRYAFEGPDC